MEGKAESRRKGVKKYEESLLSWKAAGDQLEEARTLKNMGDVYSLLGEYQTAFKHYKQALLLNRQLNDQREEGETLDGIGIAYLTLGENQKALEYCNQALKLSQAVGNRQGEALALNNIGEAYSGFGKLQRAIEFYHQAMPLWLALGDRRGQAQTLTYLGYTYSDLGEPQKAFDCYKQALSHWRGMNDHQGQGSTLVAIGRLYSRLGESQEALNSFNQAMPFVQLIGDRIEQARILNGIGYVHEILGEQQNALEYYDQALDLFRTTNYRSGEASTLLEIGRVYYSMGDNQKALDYFQHLLSMSQTLANRRFTSYALRGIGMVYDSEGSKTKALEFYDKALPLYRAGKDRRGEAFTLNLIGRIYHRWGEKQRALGYYNRALPLNQAAGDRIRESLTLYNIAWAKRDLGKLTEARSQMEESLKIVESLRTKVVSQGLRASYFASIHQYYDLYIDLLMQMHKRRPSARFDAIALQANERARARGLLELLSEARAEIRQGLDSALLGRERSLQQEINDKAERRARLLSGKHTEAEATAIAKEIDKLTAEYDEVRSQIRAQSPRYAALTQPQPLGLEEIQRQVLDDNTLLLEYALGDERSYLWAVTQTSIASYELPKRAVVEKAALGVYDLLRARQPMLGESDKQHQERVANADTQYGRQAAALSQMLLGRVAGQLGTKRLLVVAEGALQYIPFAALTVPGVPEHHIRKTQANQGAQIEALTYLGAGHEIISLPSASALAVLRRETKQRQPAPKAVAVLADPVFTQDDSRVLAKKKQAPAEADQPLVAELHRALRDFDVANGGFNLQRLPFSYQEAKGITALTRSGDGMMATGFEANRAKAMSPELRQYRIIHFATHGLLDGEHPELSGVVLSLVDQQGQPQNGFLRLHDIYNLDLPAELVVLSACNTGLGKEVKGEGLIGLTRGFMYAGAKGVMASLWKVDDDATAELMKRFYQQVLEKKLPPAAALKEAQVAMMKEKRWAAPYYWAAFVLQGEWR